MRALLFLIGMVGVITRRNVMIIFMSIELMLSSVNLNLLAFSRLYGLHGQVFALFIAATPPLKRPSAWES